MGGPDLAHLEIPGLEETNQKITNENDEFYTNIENVSNDLKQSVI